MTEVNEVQINAQLAAVCNQRNNAQNEVVNMTGMLAVANARIEELEKELEAAKQLAEASIAAKPEQGELNV